MDDLDLGATIKGFIPGQKVFNRYTLTRILGRGGMGVVWLARDEKLERDIALKFLPEVVAADPRAVDELKRETRRSLELTHPHIVRIYDFVEDARTAAIAMEYIPGATLANLVLEQPQRAFDPAALTAWVQQLCEALDYAHRKAKVVHRDLKPANLMVDAAGELKVADFGIAASVSDSVSRVSQQGGTSGTPVYMSPQQMMGEKPAVTDDVYALGATLYDLLTGKPPFYTGNIILQVQSKVPPSVAERRAELDVRNTNIPPEWEATIAACLAKEAKDRPQSAGEVLERLRSREGRKEAPTIAKADSAKPAAPSPTAIPASTVRKSKSIILVVAGVIAAVAAAGWYFGLHLPERRWAEEMRIAEGGMRAEMERAREEAEAREAEAARGGSMILEKEPHFVLEGLGLEMRHIPVGSFQMGSASGGASHEKPVTRVTLTKPFWLGATEVTQAQWQAIMGSNPSHFKGANLPVEQVNWTEAMEFCRKLTERERTAGRLPAGYVYTLPTEAQWEYACRAGTTGDYAGNLDAMGWYSGNAGGSTKPVGTKQANGWGLHDMHGNVWEWCLDWYGNYPGGSVTDPAGPPSGSSRVFRGGGWLNTADHCRSAYRFRFTPDYRYHFLGFRPALSFSP